MNIYLRKVASEAINYHVEHCIFVLASRVFFSSRCPTFRVSLFLSILFDFVLIFDSLFYVAILAFDCGINYLFE